MTFLAWANGRKWHDWIVQGFWLCSVAYDVSKGWYDMALMFLVGIMAITLHQYIRDTWKHRAYKMLELSHQQRALMNETIKHLPAEKAHEFRKKLDALTEGLANE